MPPEPAGLPPELVHLQRTCNRQSAARWEHFTRHRERLTALCLGAARPGGRLAVLGAGNGNDLDLERLTGRFAEVHLFDLDAEALARAAHRHRGGGLVVRPPLDLSGALSGLAGFRRRPPGDEEIARLPGMSVEAVLAAIPERFEVVVSACLLSQLLHGAHVALGAGHPRLTAVSCALVLAHLRLLALLVRPGGAGLLVTDALAAPPDVLDAALAQEAPARLLAQLEADHVCAAGTGPRFLREALTGDGVAGPLVEAATLVEPWPWRWSDGRSYLVHALTFTTRALPAPDGSPRCGGRPDLRRSNSENRR
jgi:hypothetical protein